VTYFLNYFFREANMSNRHREWNLACKIYVGNLGNNATKYELEDSFNRYGKLKNVWVARNPPGFAFIEFEDERDAEDACKALDGTRICGSRATVIYIFEDIYLYVCLWRWRGMRPQSKDYPVKRFIPISRSDRVVQLDWYTPLTQDFGRATRTRLGGINAQPAFCFVLVVSQIKAFY
jgi:hypothetical protein